MHNFLNIDDLVAILKITPSLDFILFFCSSFLGNLMRQAENSNKHAAVRPMAIVVILHP